MKKERIYVGLFLLGVACLTIFDMISDYGEGAELSHLLLEAAIALSALSAMLYLWTRIASEKKLSERLIAEKEILRDMAAKYHQTSKIFLEGLSVQIDREFTEWTLSEAERDIAFLLLKGIGPKQIAEMRNSSEKTVRHQIGAIYKKSGLKGREELTAHFLEDLLSPVTHE